ncbi:hypothetical protein Tco_0834672 [Tanacetum coccineum]
MNEVFGAHNVSKAQLSDDDARPHVLGADFDEASFSSSGVDQTELKSGDVHLAKNIEAATFGLEALMENKEFTCLGLMKKLRCVKVGFNPVGNVRREVGFWTEVLRYLENKTKAPGRRTYGMVNRKWKTVHPNVARFCRVYANVMRRVHASGARHDDYFAMVLLDYEAEHGMSFTLSSKRYKTYRSSSFNTESGDASINLNVHVGDDEEDEVQEL